MAETVDAIVVVVSKGFDAATLSPKLRRLMERAARKDLRHG